METLEKLLMQNLFRELYIKGRIDEKGYNRACKQIFKKSSDTYNDNTYYKENENEKLCV